MSFIVNVIFIQLVNFALSWKKVYRLQAVHVSGLFGWSDFSEISKISILVILKIWVARCRWSLNFKIDIKIKNFDDLFDQTKPKFRSFTSFSIFTYRRLLAYLRLAKNFKTILEVASKKFANL